MAAITETKTSCSICQYEAEIITCRGCEKDFCHSHVAEHRQELTKQMDELTTDHDQLQQTIADQEAQPDCHPLMENIKAWEQESINKIHQAADNARRQVLIIVRTCRTQVIHGLGHLTTELNKARNEDGYVETDLKEWTEKLEKLKADLAAAQTIDFNQENTENSLIPRIFINHPSTDFFEKTINDIQIIESGRVVLHGQTQDYGSVRGRGEYSFGQNLSRFKMEQCVSNGSFYCGILSKTASIESLEYVSTNHNICGSGYQNSGTITAHHYNGLFYFIVRNTNNDDIFELFIDCDRQIICLTNERTRQRQDLDIDLSTCPYPWQFFITLLYANDRVRLCEEKYVVPSIPRSKISPATDRFHFTEELYE
jgi:hypothetical protein